MIPIQNIYYMLTYAFKVLNQNGYKKIATEEFQNTADLFAAILIKGISTQIKRGLGREYILESSELSAVRGRIDISESIKKQSILRKKVVCSYDNLSVDNQMNGIIKASLEILLIADISKKRKKELRKLMIYFFDVNPVDVMRVNWNINYNRNNQTYRMLISVCYLLVKGLIHTTSDGIIKLMDFLDEQRMSSLYEKFILEYYKKHFPGLYPKSSQIPWAIDDGEDFMLPKMQTDIHLQKGNTVLIIDAKYYTKNTQENYGKYTIHSQNLYQIFTYVKNREYQFIGKENTVSGMLLYAKTDSDILPDKNYIIHGSAIYIRILDLDQTFDKISYQLDNIVKNCFTDIRKF